MYNRKKLLVRALCMLAPFLLILLLIFSPVFPGNVNGLNYLDNLFNSISKGSSYFIPKYRQQSAAYAGVEIAVSFTLNDERQAELAQDVLRHTGAGVEREKNVLKLQGNMEKILQSCLTDCDLLFHNDSEALQKKYGRQGKAVLYSWWQICKGVSSDLTAQELFAKAQFVTGIQKKVVETSYNYYGITAGSYKDSFFLISCALLFYLLYTVWYGFGIMFLFEGLGLRIGH